MTFNSPSKLWVRGRHDCISLAMRRSLRVNQEVLLRATFFGWSFFFARGRAMNGLAGRHRDVEGHDQAVGVAELGVLNAEAARFEVGEHRLDAPAGRILKRIRVFPGLQATRSGTSR